MVKNETDYYSSIERLKTAEVRDHQVGVLIDGSFVSNLDKREYVDISTYTVRPWQLGTGRKVRSENWQAAGVEETTRIVNDLDRIIAELMEHRMRLQREINQLFPAMDAPDEEE